VVQNNLSKKDNTIQPYDLTNLEKYFDKTLYKNLTLLTYSPPAFRRLTIVFWDLSGFSILCNELRENQEAITYFLNDYFDKATEIISEYDGILDKFIGDGILAYFGYPNDNINTPFHAGEAALKLRTEFDKIKTTHTSVWKDHYGKKIDVNIRCGIHVGYAYFGLIQNKRNQITAIGTNVNLASRLEHFAERNQIIASDEVKNITGEHFHFDPIEVTPDKEIKSFPYIKTVYSLTKLKDQAIRDKDDHRIRIQDSFYRFEKMSQEDLINIPTTDKFHVSERFFGNVTIEYANIFTNDNINYVIHSKIFGVISKGFLDILIITPPNTESWEADPSSFDHTNLKGTLELNNAAYESKWEFTIPPQYVSNFKLYLLVYEDTLNTYEKRRVVAGCRLVPDE
jgi:class 3 adenylate cyclase